MTETPLVKAEMTTFGILRDIASLEDLARTNPEAFLSLGNDLADATQRLFKLCRMAGRKEAA